MKLEDVPEMGYLSTDKPLPRGELCVQTPTMANGYFTNNGQFVDQWFHTG